MSIPNPISLLQLQQCYDALVSENPPSLESIRSLRLVCSIFIKVLGHSSRIKQTARRCHLIEQYLLLQQQQQEESSFQQDVTDESNNNNEEDLINVSIKQNPDGTWTWSSIIYPEDEDIVLSMDREELAQEEATLWQMANTPIPFHDTNQEQWKVKQDSIREQIRLEWKVKSLAD